MKQTCKKKKNISWKMETTLHTGVHFNISWTPRRFACITCMDKQSDNAFGMHAWALMIFENDLGDETEDDSSVIGNHLMVRKWNSLKTYENNQCKFLQKHFHWQQMSSVKFFLYQHQMSFYLINLWRRTQ